MRKLFFALALGAVMASPGAAWNEIEGPVQNFPVEQWLNGFEGQTLEDLRGKVVLMELWATW